MLHALKTWPEFFGPLAEGKKTFDIRKNDRPFKVGDSVIFQEWNPEETGDVENRQHVKGYTGRELEAEITHIFDNEKMGVKKGFVILSFKPNSNKTMGHIPEIRKGKIADVGYYDNDGTPRYHDGNIMSITEASEHEKADILRRTNALLPKNQQGAAGLDVAHGVDYNDQGERIR